MLGLEPRAARAAWTVFLVSLLLWLIYKLRRVLFVLFAAVLLAYLLAPAVNLLGRFTRRRLSRTVALAAVYVLFVGVIVLVLTLLGVRVAEEASALAGKLPVWAQELGNRLQVPAPAWLEPARAAVLDTLRQKLANAGEMVLPLLQKATAGVASLVGGIIVTVLIAVLSFFLLKDGEELKHARSACWIRNAGPPGTTSSRTCTCCSASSSGRWCCFRWPRSPLTPLPSA